VPNRHLLFPPFSPLEQAPGQLIFKSSRQFESSNYRIDCFTLSLFVLLPCMAHRTGQGSRKHVLMSISIRLPFRHNQFRVINQFRRHPAKFRAWAARLFDIGRPISARRLDFRSNPISCPNEGPSLADLEGKWEIFHLMRSLSPVPRSCEMQRHSPR
jgi:hypothetical protein